MSNQEPKGKRSLKNSDYNKILENTENTEENINQTADKDIQVTVQNTQENQRNVNQQINIESSPALYSRDQMMINNQTTPIQMQVQPNQNALNNIPIGNNQIQQVPIQASQMVGIRNVPMNGIILNHQIGVIPIIEKVRTYKPFETTCPYCFMTGMTIPETSWNCCACFGLVCVDIYFLGLVNCVRLCQGSDCCCFDALHKCSNCGRIIAKRETCYG